MNEKKTTFAMTPKKVKRMVNCSYENCNNTFMGYANSKFCQEHKDPKTRGIFKKEIILEKSTFEFKHDYTTTSKIKIERNCDCCGKSYQLKIFALMYDYPRFCQEHTNKYKREFYRKQNGLEQYNEKVN